MSEFRGAMPELGRAISEFRGNKGEHEDVTLSGISEIDGGLDVLMVGITRSRLARK